jgi:uncharacterized LabA/DUF88 family protein
MPTAILVDGGFFVKRLSKVYRDPTKMDPKDPKAVAQTLYSLATAHLVGKHGDRRDLYRIFFYDCPPLLKKVHFPISKKSVDFSKSPVAKFRNELHDELRQLRKVALRLGHVSDDGSWSLYPDKLKDLLNKRISFSDLVDDDFFFNVRQKGVDMRIGLDIASLAYKRLTDQIVLIAGDSDFVPAAKLARREGIDFILDPMWNPIHTALNEHIDGLRSTCPNPNRRPAPSTEPLPVAHIHESSAIDLQSPP